MRLHIPMLSRYLMVLIVAALFSAEADISSGQQAGSELLTERLRTRIEYAGGQTQITVGSEIIYASIALPRFYETRGYRPAWSDEGAVQPAADSLIVFIRAIDADGLEPEHYHLSRASSLINKVRSKPEPKPLDMAGHLIDLDLLLTDAYLICAAHLLAGRINPETIDAEWKATLRERDLVSVLVDALAKKRIRESLLDLLPDQAGYFRLRESLVKYQKLAAAGGWPQIEDRPALELGSQDSRVAILRKRLALTGDLPSNNVGGDTLDENDVQAIKTFQQRHGLDVDGKIGPKTLAALNLPVEQRIQQIMINLERWRWLPEDFGSKYILVNIANYELDVIEDHRTVMTMRAIVGRPYRRTPVFSDRVTYMVFSPFWNIPPSLVVKDVLPQIRKDSTYLAKQRIRVFHGWGAEMEELDPQAINWAATSAKGLPFWLRQDPGPLNSLGGVKFMFPNKFNVYLHDTPKRELFGKTERGFSSGCIRIERPADLAEYLLQDDTNWNRDKIITAMNRGVEQTVNIGNPLPIHILYWTAWVTEDGTVHFREDIYKRDQRLADALMALPPKYEELTQ